jgi:hypothetical protein
MSEPTCLTCKYFRNAQIMGTCRRFPAAHNKHQNDWCGEHSIAIELVPVYDITTDETTMAIMPAKKPGRKPKNDKAVA